MAIDEKKMSAWLNADAKDQGGKGGGKKGATTAPPKKGQPKPKAAKDVEQEGDEQESPEETAAEGNLEQEFPTLFQLLEDNGDEISEATDTVNPDLLTDKDADFEDDDDEYELLKEAVNSLPDEVKKAMQAEAKDIDWDKALEIADALDVGGHINVAPERIAGLLFHGVHCLGEGEDDGEKKGDDQGGDEEPEEDGEDEGEE